MKLIEKILMGIAGGMSATGPMTTAMLALHRCLPLRHRYPLPPREIAVKMLPGCSDKAELVSTLTAHFAFGGAMGALYGLCTPAPARQWAWKGLAGGLAVWAANYLLLLPILRILRPAHRQPSERNLLMIVAHLVWGVTLAGFLASVVEDDSKSRGLFRKSPLPHRDA